MKSRSHEARICRSFDSFCKKVLKHNAIDLQRQDMRRGAREVPFSEMSPHELAKLAVSDEYFLEERIFDVLDENIGVTNAELSAALNDLSKGKRDVILMAYFFDMTDQEIATRLNMVRRTVTYQRTSSLQELKKLLESEEDHEET